MQAFPRAQTHGHAFIRLLARISGAGATAPMQSLSDRLGQWIDWRHAVALSAALEAQPAAVVDPGCVSASTEDGELGRVRTALVDAIEGDRAFADGAPPEAAGTDVPDAALEAGFYRQRYLTLQQVMEGEIGRLRGRLRVRLAARSAALGRLAAVDAVLQQALGARERALLAPVPELLAGHFERLRQAAHETPDASVAENTASVTTWRDGFRRDMKQLLLAELDIRMQPAQGLLAALRDTPSESHAS